MRSFQYPGIRVQQISDANTRHTLQALDGHIKALVDNLNAAISTDHGPGLLRIVKPIVVPAVDADPTTKSTRGAPGQLVRIGHGHILQDAMYMKTGVEAEDTDWVAVPTGTSSFGPATGSIGLAEVDGTSSLFMRADAAPKLSQGIQPVWTSPHRWSSYLECDEIAAPATPAAGRARLYGKDSGGVSSLFMLRDDGTEVDLSLASGATFQPLNSYLTTISGLTPANDDFLQFKAGDWVNRKISDVKPDLGLSGTNSGDQTITLTGDVTGSGTGSFATSLLMTATRNWTAGVHTFADRDVHTLGIDLSTSGVVKSTVATAGVVYDLQDSIGAATRTSGTMLRLGRAADTRYMVDVTWDGRFGFGYSSSPSIAQGGCVLGFVQTDNDSPAGAPHYVGIFGEVQHFSASQSPPSGPLGIVGMSALVTATGLTGNLQAGLLGTVNSSVAATMAGKVFAGVVGTGASVNAGHWFPATVDPPITKNNHFKSGPDHITSFWSQILCMNSATGIGTTFPGKVSSARLGIQDYGAPSTDAANTTEYWAIYGETVATAGLAASFPAVTGYLRMTYPRRTGRTGVRAMHAYWEPWPNTATIRGGGIDGDTYFDNGTNFRKGLWEYAGAWLKLLQYKQTDALGGGAAATLGTIGGAGPTVAAQAKWLQVVALDGTAAWVPAWV